MLPVSQRSTPPSQLDTDMATPTDTRLRKRSVSEKSAPTSLLSPGRDASRILQSTSGHGPKTLLFLISLAISSYFAWDRYFAARRAPLSASYALCSSTESQIYAVDATNPRPQCLVVHDNKFMFTGSLGEYRTDSNHSEIHRWR